jgi:hypothetical protein
MGILPTNHSFQGKERFILFPISLISKVEETPVSQKTKPSVLEAGASCAFFHVRTELVFCRNTTCKSQFSRVRRVPLFQTGFFSKDKETNVPLQRKP